jgi:anti-sigma regulatory factor (Ser/Thr protein kinase)
MTRTAFAHHVDDVGGQLADGTWPPAEYRYHHVDLPASLLAPGHARAWAGAELDRGGLSARERDDVMLLLSELVTNAVRHAGRGEHAAVTVRLAVADGSIRIEVCDAGDGFSPAQISRPAPDAIGGRGLFVIDAMAARWGTHRGGDHCVWLELRRARLAMV